MDCEIDISGKELEAGCNDVAFFVHICNRPEWDCKSEYTKSINIILPDGIELMNKDEVKAEAGIATAVIRIDEERGSKKIFVNDGEISGEIDICIK